MTTAGQYTQRLSKLLERGVYYAIVWALCELLRCELGKWLQREGDKEDGLYSNLERVARAVLTDDILTDKTVGLL